MVSDFLYERRNEPNRKVGSSDSGPKTTEEKDQSAQKTGNHSCGPTFDSAFQTRSLISVLRSYLSPPTPLRRVLKRSLFSRKQAFSFSSGYHARVQGRVAHWRNSQIWLFYKFISGHSLHRKIEISESWHKLRVS